MKFPVKQKTQFSLAYLLIAVLVLSLVQSWLLAPRTVEIPMSKFMTLLREDKVERLSITDREIRGILKPGALPPPSRARATRYGAWWAPISRSRRSRPRAFPASTTAPSSRSSSSTRSSSPGG
jgi:FtsH Extracellular.